MNKIERRMLPIGEVMENPRNDRVHPRSQIDLIKASVAEFGQPRPILVRKANRMMIAGHGVRLAMIEMGHTEIDSLLWDVDQRTADKFLLADNRFAELSHSDPDRRRSLLEGLRDDEFAAIGFLPEEIANIVKNDYEIAVEEIDTDPVDDRFWISVHGDLRWQAEALKRLQLLMADLPGVEVELGVTPG